MPIVLESPHPYTNNFNQTYTYTLAGSPASIDVVWDTLTNTETSWDFIHVTDGADVPIAGSPFTGTTLAGTVKTITGDTVKIRLVADEIYSDFYGFAVDVVEGGTGVPGSLTGDVNWAGGGEPPPPDLTPSGSNIGFYSTADLLDLGYDGESPAADSSALVGIMGDSVIRGLYPIQGGRLLAVTEHGAYLRDQASNSSVGTMLVTNEFSPDYGALGFDSAGCSIPFWHVNVNLMADGRQSPFGFVSVRRADDAGGFAVWNIHFDPADLNAVGPIIGRFHFPRDPFFSPTDQFRLQEVTWLDGCSTNTLHLGHQDGYQPNLYLGDPQHSGAASQKFEGGSWPLDQRPNRFWDSYLVFRVLISVQNAGIPERPWAYGPVPKAISAYLIFANGGSRGPEDPPLKLVRVHVTNSAALVKPGDEWPGQQILRDWLAPKFRQDIPYLPSVPLGAGNYMYSSPMLGTWGARASQVIRNNAQYLNVHGEWPERVWVTVDDTEWDRDLTPHYPGTLEIPGFENVKEWTSHLGVDPGSERDDWPGGLVSSKFYTVTPADKQWVPGMFLAGQVDYGSTDSGEGLMPVPNALIPPWTMDENEIPCYRRHQLAIRAVAARGRTMADEMTAKTWVSASLGLTCEEPGPQT